jgi:hypothetical protein
MASHLVYAKILESVCSRSPMIPFGFEAARLSPGFEWISVVMDQQLARTQTRLFASALPVIRPNSLTQVNQEDIGRRSYTFSRLVHDGRVCSRDISGGAFNPAVALGISVLGI